MERIIIDREEIVIRFAGDSGDGMQLTGTLFANTAALEGNETSTFPDYPAEIRAPHGTIAGVSGFQVHIGNEDVHTPGDFCDVLVAMNPAALKANAQWAKPTATVIVDIDSFTESGMEKAMFHTNNPVAELHLEGRNFIPTPITTMTKECLKDSGLDAKSILRCKNMFALGICFFLFDRPLCHTDRYFESKFKKKPELIEPNKKILRAGFNYASNIQAIANTYHVSKANLPKGTYRNISGNVATAWGLLAAAEKAGLPLFCGSYPITPATTVLEELALHKGLGAKTLQCEDEIAGICTSIGAAYTGCFAVTSTSGPGLSLKSEALGLAQITELPLVIVDVQRAGPSTGIPTKTEQTDLNQALYGRNGECPIAIIAPHSPAHCFDAAFYAGKYAMEHMMPVILLSEGFLGNGTEPWRIPSMADYPEIKPPFIREPREGEATYRPFQRDPETKVRNWAVPGTPDLEHRVGGLEKDPSGCVSSDPLNHAHMTRERAAKIDYLSRIIPAQKVFGKEAGEVLVVSWGGTYGHTLTAVKQAQAAGLDVSLAHVDYINPLPRNLGQILGAYKKILVCELNDGQFANYLRAKFPQYSYLQYNKVQGQPFTVTELVQAIQELF